MSSVAARGLQDMTIDTGSTAPAAGSAAPTGTVHAVYSVSIPVLDQDAALAFYTDVLGCELLFDEEVMPGARMIEVAPPGGGVRIALVHPEAGLPVGVRFLVDSADAAHRRIVAAGVGAGEVLRWDGVPAMFEFTDPEDNVLVVLEGSPDL